MSRIQQWTVTLPDRRVMTFEREDLAIGAGFDVASPATPTVVRYPDGEEFVVLKRHPAWKIQVIKEI